MWNRYNETILSNNIIQSVLIKSAAAAAAASLQSCPTLCDPIDGSPPGSPLPGILQARTLEWVAISSSNAWKWKVKVKSVAQSCLTLSDPMDCSLPGSSIHGIFQARVLEWGAIAFIKSTTCKTFLPWRLKLLGIPIIILHNNFKIQWHTTISIDFLFTNVKWLRSLNFRQQWLVWLYPTYLSASSWDRQVTQGKLLSQQWQKYWVGQKVSLGFSISCWRKNLNKILANLKKEASSRRRTGILYLLFLFSGSHMANSEIKG